MTPEAENVHTGPNTFCDHHARQTGADSGNQAQSRIVQGAGTAQPYRHWEGERQGPGGGHYRSRVQRALGLGLERLAQNGRKPAVRKK